MVDGSCIDNELLISLVEQKPILWDKTMEHYKNRVATRAAWKEIIIVINPDFEKKEVKTRQAFAKLIIQRWTHIRDNYNRSYKKIQDQKRSGSGAKTAKPYVYSKQLSFLQKIVQPKETISNDTTENHNTETEKQKNNSEGNETLEANFVQTSDNMVKMSPIPKSIHKRPMKNAVNPLDAKMMKFMDSYSYNESKTMNRHLSFFNGIIPTLDKFDDDEVLEFQMGVLQLLKNIKSSRRRESPSEIVVVYRPPMNS
ncbi:uncharacterized protein LOC101739359 [Bombyx mori]|uniref:MADF domain-containing protein n=1 Tax=Bombyx mori TaxID=7091 RepID=A0A8R1WJB1_BOMMO|nr:uncharacterized protein LOC101739359 [Bombyx mori]